MSFTDARPVVVSDAGQIHVGVEPTITLAFERFHAENPHVYAELVRLARSWQNRRSGKCGVGMLWEVMRWNLNLSTTGEPLKLNNNYRSRYVRLIIEQEPELEDLFETRELRSL